MTSQRHFRFRMDTGASDAAPTWGAVEDSNTFTPGPSPFRLRLSIENPTHTATGSLPYQIYLSKNGGAYSAITTSSTNGIKSADAGSDADNTSIFIPRLTVPAWTVLAGAAIDLDFANDHIYPSGAFSDYLSISRASIGYAKTSAGGLTQFSSNVLRITDLGLLVEDAVTNICRHSEDLSNAASWSNYNCTLTTGVSDLAGGTNAFSFIENVSAADIHDSNQVRSITSGTARPFTISCYLKAQSTRNMALYVLDQTGDGYVFKINTTSWTVDVSHGATLTNGSYTLTAMADGWYYFTATVTTDTTTTSMRFHGVLLNGTTVNYVGDGVSGIYIYAPQIEESAFGTSYIPTTTTSAVRAADVITCISDLQTDIAAATASLIAQINNGKVTSIAANIIDSNGTNLLGFDASNHGLASITATLTTGNTANRTTQDKLGIAWNALGRSLVLNGGTVATDATAQTPSSTQHIGSSGAANFAFAYIKRLTVWTSKLADATLQGHTT